MKKKIKRALALIALATVIGVGLAACDRMATAAAPETASGGPSPRMWTSCIRISKH